MNQPETNTKNFKIDPTSGNGIYKFHWESELIDARVDRIKESTDHEVKGEVLIESRRPTSAGHLVSGRLNLTSPTTRKAFARSLKDRDSEVDWDKIMEQLCVAVLDEWRRGSPEVLLDGNTDVEAQAKWLVEPIIQLNNPTLIYGPGSTGKSWFGQYLAVLADAGMPRNGLGVEPCESKVLYLDWETDQQEIGSRITLIRRGLEMEGQSAIWYKTMNQGLANDIETVRNICVDHEIELVIVDSLGSACMGEPESAEVVLRTFAALRSLGVSSLCIDHTNKEGTLFGSVYKFNAARMVFECKKDQQQDDDKLVFGLFHKKANNSKLMKPIGFELNFNDSNITISRQDVRDTRLEEHMGIRDRIEHLLKNKEGGMSIADIAEELGKTESHIRKEISEGRSRYAKFTKLPNGNWANLVREDVETWRI